MTSELQKLDIATTIKDRIKAQFVDLIPDDVFQKMVEAEIHNFITDKPGDRWNKDSPSPIRKLIQAEVEGRFKEKIQKDLNNPKYDPIWNGCGYDLPEQFKQVVISAAPQILENMIGRYTADILTKFRNEY